MKKLTLFTFAIFLFNACEKPILGTKATLLYSTDNLPCYCCNGIYAQIDNDTFNTRLPSDFEIDKFPLDVEIKYYDHVLDCNVLDVYEIKKR